MATIDLNGRRYINLLRASSNSQDTSTDDQKLVNDKWAAKHGLTHVGDVVLKGVSGSKTFNRRDLKDLLDAHRILRNYDVIVVYDSSRLTRGGAAHGFSVRRDFALEGILVLSVMDPLPEGDFKDVMQSIIDTQNHLYAKRLSGYVARGIVTAVQKGTVEKHGASPIGCDRQYIGVDGRPVARLCYLPGGARRLIDERTKEVIATFARGERPTAARLLIPGEKVRLVMGDPKIVEVLREAFRLRYVQGVGYLRIGKYLASAGVKPLRSNRWSPGGVRDILINPTYLGWSYFLQFACGLFNAGTIEGPEAREVDQAKLEREGRLTIPRDRRPVTKMMTVQHPELKEFITHPLVRENAEKFIKAYYERWHLAASEPKRSGDTRPTSRYFLRGVLRDKHYHRSFSGQTTGKKGEARYYFVAPVAEFEERETPLAERIHATPLEDAILQVLKHVYGTVTNVEEVVERYVGSVLKEQPTEVNRATLNLEDAELKAHLQLLTNTLSGRDLNEVKGKLTELRRRRDEIAQMLSAIDAASCLTDVPKFVESIVNEVKSFETKRKGSDDDFLFDRFRLFVKTVCPLITVNLETMEAEAVIALPKRAVTSKLAHWTAVCEPSAQQDSFGCLAHRSRWLEIARVRFLPIIEGPPRQKNGGSLPRYSVLEWEVIRDLPPDARRRAA